MEQETSIVKEEKGFTFADFWYVIRKFWILIAAITLVATAAGTIYSFASTKPSYRSSSNAIVAVESETQAGTQDVDYDKSLRVVNTVGEFVHQEFVLESVAKEYNVSVGYLAGGVSASVSSSSFIITVSFVDADPDNAQKYCDAIVKSLIKVCENDEAVKKLKVTVSQTSPASPGALNTSSKKLYIIAGLGGGLVLGVIAAFIAEAVANKFSSKSDVEDHFPDIAVIGKFYQNKCMEDRNKKSHRRRAAKLVGNTVRELEPYNTLLSNIYYANPENPYKAVLVTSTEPEDLKTTTVANLAYCAATNGKKVVLIDFDVRKPTIHRTFRVEKENGLIDFIGGTSKEEDIIKHSESGVDIITPGLNVVNPVVLIQSEKIASLIKSLKEKYDYVFIDTPPVGVCNDALVLSKVADGVVFNIALAITKKSAAEESVKSLRQYGAKIIGLNLTKYPLHAKNERNASYYYNYYNTDSSEGEKEAVTAEKK
ncbi:MAG: polysaccharide biosynthesis tyrosine autokinase [Bacilli bacterium]|nr:polysaccharide biosynthesis tyrosine autokinase [Bacilli bacterium]